MSEINHNGFDVDDPRLTAYALGELAGDERAEVERLLAEHPEARAFVAELSATTSELERGLAQEPKLELSAEQRASIAHRARPAPALSRRWIWLGAAAAGLLAVSGLAFFALQAKRSVDSAHPEHTLGIDFNTRNTPASDPSAQGTYRGRGDTDGSTAYPNSPSVKLAESGNVAPTATLATGTAAPEEANEIVSLEEQAVSASSGGTAIGVGRAGHRGAPAVPAYGFRAGSKVKARALTANERQSLQGLGYAGDEPSGGVQLLEREGNTEAYAPIVENPFKLAAQDPLSTFSIDVDTASYANVRRFLNSNQLPPPDAVRVEELLNYFRFEYPRPDGEAPFSVSARVASCPWAPRHQLVQVGLRGQDIDLQKRTPSNLVFLIDVSGSMDSPDKLPLLVSSMKLLVEQLDGRDRLAMVVYAGASGVVLPSTTCDYKTVIVNALDGLQAGGSTNGAAGIELAYQIAQANFTREGQNRVVLCTDGDFNVGVTDDGSLTRLIEEKRTSGVFLSVLGFGTGNTKDAKMELLADKGNGNYAYIDTLQEARKVLVHEMGGTLFTIAKDVKLQLEFNPAEVQAYRLIGYENRVLAHQDFNDDKKDAGEIGAGHTVTALYEVVPVGVSFQANGVDPLKYQTPATTSTAARSGELLNLKLRYKAPDGDVSKLIETPVRTTNASWQEAHPDFKFASAVAGFGLVLRKSKNVGDFTLNDALQLATQGVGEDVGGYRKEFVELVHKAQAIQAADGKPRVR